MWIHHFPQATSGPTRVHAAARLIERNRIGQAWAATVIRSEQFSPESFSLKVTRFT